MARVKRGVTAGRRHKKVLGKAKGYYNARRKVYRAAKQAVIKAGQYAYRDRRARKREFPALWIKGINAPARGQGVHTVRRLAKKGRLAAQFEPLGCRPAPERPAAGARINAAKSAVQSAIEQRRAEL